MLDFAYYASFGIRMTSGRRNQAGCVLTSVIRISEELRQVDSILTGRLPIQREQFVQVREPGKPRCHVDEFRIRNCRLYVSQGGDDSLLRRTGVACEAQGDPSRETDAYEGHLERGGPHSKTSPRCIAVTARRRCASPATVRCRLSAYARVSRCVRSRLHRMHDRVECVVRAANTANPMQERRDLIPDFRAGRAAFTLLRTEERIRRRCHHGDRIRQSSHDLADIRLHGRMIARSLIRSCVPPSTRRARTRFRRIISLRRTHGVASSQAVLW
jgi:hypothetical protein